MRQKDWIGPFWQPLSLIYTLINPIGTSNQAALLVCVAIVHT